MKSGDRLPRIWSPEARQDPFDICNYIWLDASAAIADKLLKEIDHACFVLGAWPKYGKARDQVRKGLRCILVPRYVVFYRVTKHAIEIIRVLDERRDVLDIFLNEERE